MSAERYTYYAFISYSHRDEKWAKWLHGRLEAYRLPSAVRRESGGNLPLHVRPVFRDQTDLGVGGLEQSLRRELADSRFLIVVCSPNSAKSEWVDREVRSFRDMGRGDRIIPFIVEGAPDALDPERQCYPPALRDGGADILGASLVELRPEQALVKVVAAMLGLRYDQLWQRHERHARAKRRTAGLLAFLFLALALGGACWAWDYYWPKYGYFADYTERRLMPEGLIPLTREQVGRRFEHYRFEWRKHKLRRVVHANSAGRPIPHMFAGSLDRPMVLALSYDEGAGRLIWREHLDCNGRILVREKISQDGSTVDFASPGGGEQGLALAASTTSGEHGVLGFAGGLLGLEKEETARSEICRYGIDYDERGFATDVRYFRDALGTRVCDGDGVFGKRYERDESGRVVRVVFVGLDGAVQANKLGIASIGHQYGPGGRMVRTEYRDARGDLCLDENGVAVHESVCDSDGNISGERCLGLDGAPSLYDGAFHGDEARYDDRGNIAEVAFLGPSGEPMLNQDAKAHLIRVENNELGYPVRFRLFGVDGKLCLGAAGYAELLTDLDDQGNLTQVSVFGLNGEPVLDRLLKSHMARHEYDSHGNRTRTSYFGTDGKPCICASGYAEERAVFDDRGNRTQWACYGVAGEPVLDQDDHSHTTRWQYDPRGNNTRIEYLGIDGEPCVSAYGYARVEMTYDAGGNMAESSCHGADGEPVIDQSTRAHLVCREYDGHGNNTRVLFRGVDKNPCMGAYGYAEMRMEYDEKGNVTRLSCHGVNGEAVLDVGTASHMVVSEYDTSGNNTRSVCFGTDGNRCKNKEGFAETKMEYDGRGKLTAWSCYGMDGKPVVSYSEKVHMIKRAYDARGNEEKTAYFGPDGQPCPNSLGIFVVERRFDLLNRCVEERYSDAEGDQATNANGVHRGTVAYDDRGNMTRLAAFGVDGQPVTLQGDAVALEWVYDVLDRVVEERRIGADGLPRNGAEGWARRVVRYDERGDVVSEAKYDAEGRAFDAPLVSKVPVVGLVVEDSRAEEAGLRLGDVLVEFDDWSLFPEMPVAEKWALLAETMGNALNDDKSLLVMRDGEFLRFDFPEGMVGFRLDESAVSSEDMERMRAAYEERPAVR